MAFQPPGTAKCSARALLPHKPNVSFIAAYSPAGRTPGSSPRIEVRTSCQGSERHDTRARKLKLVMRFAGGHCGCSTEVRMSVHLTRRRRRTVGYVPHWHGRREGHLQSISDTSTLRRPEREDGGEPPSVALACAVLPNPSFKPSPNGGPPGPGCRYAVHFLHPGPGVPPSVPA